MCSCAASSDAEFAGALRQYGLDPRAHKWCALQKVCSLGWPLSMRVLLAHPRFAPAAFDNQGLRHAVLGGHTGVVRLLLADGRVLPSAWVVTLASFFNRVDVMRVLLTHPRVCIPPRNFRQAAMARLLRPGVATFVVASCCISPRATIGCSTA